MRLVAPYIKVLVLALSLLLLGGGAKVRAENVGPLLLPELDRAVCSDLSQADILYLGEIHDRAADHERQLETIKSLHRDRGQIAIAMEMFQRPFQNAIDRYLTGEIDETQLRQETEYDDRWGYDWEFYAPILRYAQTHQLPVLALNVPTEITRKVVHGGLESLTPEERQQIPPTEEIRTDNLAYREILAAEFNRHLESGHGSSEDVDRFFLVQVLWDETMAETIARFWQANPDTQIIVLAGKGHIENGYGIPSRVERRLSEQNLEHCSIIPSA